MNRISFYRQARSDGGVRSGVDVNGGQAWSIFEPGAGDPDPALEWYVDIEWSGSSLPTDADEAKALLLAQEPRVSAACEALASRLEVGIDAEPAPFTQSFDAGLSGVKAGVYCSAVHRVSGRDMGRNLKFIGTSWSRLLKQLHPVSVEAA